MMKSKGLIDKTEMNGNVNLVMEVTERLSRDGEDIGKIVLTNDTNREEVLNWYEQVISENVVRWYEIKKTENAYHKVVATVSLNTEDLKLMPNGSRVFCGGALPELEICKMESSFIAFLNHVFESFKRYLEVRVVQREGDYGVVPRVGENEAVIREAQWKNMQGQHYRDGNVPTTEEYNKKGVQLFYMFRYMGMYVYEYQLMYEKVLSDMIQHASIPARAKVLSLGCGYNTDCIGFQLAREKKEINQEINLPLEYHGVDIVNWAHWEYAWCAEKDGDEVEFVETDAVKYLQERKSIDENLIVFPYSLSEFNSLMLHENVTMLDEICSILNEKLVSDSLYILITIRTGGNPERLSPNDRIAIEKLKDMLCDCNSGRYFVEAEYTEADSEKKENIKSDLKRYYNNYNEVVTLAGWLDAQAENDREEAGAEKKLACFPTLRTDYVAYRILKLKRREHS